MKLVAANSFAGSAPRLPDLITTQIPTTTPAETLESVVEFFRREAGGELKAVGIASFGPVDPHPGSPTFGYITCTPKLGWRGTDVAGTVGSGLGVPVGFDTDVNGAALGEARWGAARGLADFLYLLWARALAAARW